MRIKGSILLVLLIVFAVISYFIWSSNNSYKRTRSTQEWIDHTNNEIKNIDEVYSGMTEIESATRGFVITNEEQFIKNISEKYTSIESNLKKATVFASDNSQQKERIIQLIHLCRKKIDRQKEIILARREDPEISFKIVSNLEGKVLMDSIKTTVASIKQRENDLLQKKVSDSRKMSQAILETIIWSGIATFLFALALLLKLNFDFHLRRKIQNSHEDEQFRFQSILDNAPQFICIRNLQGKYLMVNKAFSDNMQISQSDVIGKSFWDIMPPDLAEKFSQADYDVQQSGKMVEIDGIIPMPGGEKHLHIINFPIYDKKEVMYGIAAIATNITRQKQYQLQLIEAKKTAENALKMQEQFLANVSHGIRTPMNGIVGMSNLLAQTSLSEQQEEYVNLILQSSDTLGLLINDILDLSKIKSGQIILENKTFDILETIERVLAFWSIKAREKNLDLTVSMHPNIPEFLEGDSIRLSQILNNILSNAIKFTSKGHINFSVSALINNDKVQMRFEIADTGIGISEENLDYIFESFTQAGKSNIHENEGAGLGLSITRMLVHLQHGTIHLESKQGAGTTFFITIPYLLAKAPPAFTIKKDLLPDISGFKNKKVLIAEDNLTNQKIIYLQLKQFGIDAKVVSNGKEVIQWIEQGNQPDLIIMDLRMPEMNGFQTTLYLRKQLIIETPIIAITASVLHDEQRKCMAIGMNGFLAKPFSPKALLALLKQFLDPEKSDIFFLSPSDIKDEPGEKLYDLSALIELDEPGFLTEALDTFINDTSFILKEISQQTLKENWDEVYARAHRLKSNVGLFQITSIFNLLGEIEKLSTKKDGFAIAGIIDLIEEQLGILIPMLKMEKDKSLVS